jgi:hypothetical protein
LRFKELGSILEALGMLRPETVDKPKINANGSIETTLKRKVSQR